MAASPGWKAARPVVRESFLQRCQRERPRAMLRYVIARFAEPQRKALSRWLDIGIRVAVESPSSEFPLIVFAESQRIFNRCRLARTNAAEEYHGLSCAPTEVQSFERGLFGCA